MAVALLNNSPIAPFFASRPVLEDYWSGLP